MRARFALFLWLLMTFAGPQLVFAAGEKAKEKDKEAEAQKPMDWLTFASKAIESCAWPLVALIIFWHYRSEVPQLLKRLTKFEGPGIKGEFGKALEDAEKKAEAAQLPSTPSTPVPTVAQKEPIDAHLDFLIKVAPSAAVLTAWKEVESETSIRYGFGHSTKRVFDSKLPEELRAMYKSLKSLRNKAAHATGADITSVMAEEYVRLAQRFLAKIKQIEP